MTILNKWAASKRLRIIENEKKKQKKLNIEIGLQKLKELASHEKEKTKKLVDIVSRKRFYTWTGFKYRVLYKFRRSSIILIHMQLVNGMHTQFITRIKKNSFRYMNGTYVVDDSLKYYDIATGLWCLDYHQDINIPVQRNIRSNDIKKIVQMKGITDIDTAINPFTLKAFILSEVVEKVVAGVALDKKMRTLTIMIVIIMLCVIAVLLINLQTSGILGGLGI